MICTSSTALIFGSALSIIECPGMLATCKLSIKQTFCDSIDRWQPDRQSHKFWFSGCQLQLASKSWWTVLFRLLCGLAYFVWFWCLWHLCTVAKQLKCWADFWYGLQFISDLAIDGYFLLLLLLILMLSSLNWVSSRQVSILSPYHHRLKTLAFSCCKTQTISLFVCHWSPLTVHAPILGLYLIGS